MIWRSKQQSATEQKEWQQAMEDLKMTSQWNRLRCIVIILCDLDYDIQKDRKLWQSLLRVIYSVL